MANVICERLGDGTPLAVMCREDGMPGLRTVYDWMEAHEAFSARIARGRDAGYDMIAAEALHIADTPLEGIREVVKADGKVETTREDMLGHRRLQIETRLKLLAKWDPKRYGDATILRGDANNPLQVEMKTIVTTKKDAVGYSARATSDSLGADRKAG